MSVLIVTLPNDADAQVVKLAINHLGHDCDIFYCADLAGGAGWSLDPQSDSLETVFRGKRSRLALGRYTCVWMRRPCGVIPREHLADLRERAAAESESLSFLNSIYRIIEHGRFAANGISATRIAQEKTYQLRLAAKLGLRIPATLISNALEHILEFYHQHRGRIIYKTLVPMLWTRDEGAYKNVRTTLIDDIEMLTKSDLSAAPGIYQEAIDKVVELRVTVLGRTVLAMEKRFPNRAAASLGVDWRAMHVGAEYRAHALPDHIVDQCLALLRELNLVMGCFDLAVDAEGNYFFLEVNPQGQFLWADQICGELNHLEALVEFLLSADPEFQWSGKNNIRLSQFAERETFLRLDEVERADHFGTLLTYRYSSISVPLMSAKPPAEVLSYYGVGER